VITIGLISIALPPISSIGFDTTWTREDNAAALIIK
ncbi:hypothetical protein AAA799P11_01527, partial [Marine Group I thaumarchaeote SCGC AAA799-P11]